jgi:phytoene dehydrogenase-like protein
MSKYDVVVIGAGAAGLSAGALLAKEGKSVLVCEKSPFLGGRALAVDDQGFKVNIGGHLIEDGGSGITKIFEYVGKELIHGKVNAEMPVWDHEKNEEGNQGPGRNAVGRTGQVG